MIRPTALPDQVSHAMRMPLLIAVCALAASGAALAAPFAPIPIQVDAPPGLSEPWPVACGVPFAKGALRDAAEARLETAAGAEVPSQMDVTATWLRDGSVRWMLVHFLARPGERYRLAPNATERDGGADALRVAEEAEGITIATGGATYSMRHDEALISAASLNGRLVLADAGRGAYLVDQRGREARLGGPHSEMETRFRVRGPRWVVVRKEGWYATDAGERLARGICWMYFFGGSPHVKIVHRLVLTEDTNRVWFKDIGIRFSTPERETASAAFALSDDAAPLRVALRREESAWMLQDDFPHFMSPSSRFVAAQEGPAGRKELLSGSSCGDWCDLSDGSGGLTVALRDFAEQFPKAFAATTRCVTVHLWAGQCGRELDFRTPTLMKEYWGEWTRYSSLDEKDLATLPSNAQASAKTHTLWLLPREGADMGGVSARARAAAKRVLAFPDPSWLCGAGVMTPDMWPKDLDRFPREEAYISDFFDRMMLPQRVFPLTGYIAWGSDPAVRYLKDPATGRYYAVWWRISGLVDYHARRSAWALFARSGERKYFDYGERFNRFAGDFNMHHWDCGEEADGTRKTRGGFVGSALPKGCPLISKGVAASPGSLPIYWRWNSGKPDGSGADVFNYLHQFYFTGDWETWELAEAFAEAVKKHDFLQPKDPGWGGGFTELRYMTALYSMRWDEELGRMVRNLAAEALAPDDPNGVAGHFYKPARTSISMLDYYLHTDDENARKAFLAMVDYIFRFQITTRPVAYQSGSSLFFAMARLLGGDDRYLRLAWQSVPNVLEDHTKTLAEELAPGLDRLDRLPYMSLHYQYHACMGMPALMKAMALHGRAVSPLPLLKKNYDSTSRAWAVFRKKANEPVELQMLFEPVEADTVSLVALGPDLNPADGLEMVEQAKKEKDPVVSFQPTWMRLRLPARLPAGEYRIGQADRGQFTVLDATVDRIALECPEGFWLSQAGIEAPGAFFFEVPAGCESVDLFVNRPVQITRPDGSAAVDAGKREAGPLSLPVQGRHGRWRIRSAETAFLRFRNLPPFVSYLDGERLFVPSRAVPPEASATELPDPQALFVTGRFGAGLQLRDRRTVALERGVARPDGGYENFPGRRGTIEFWFRPNWTATDMVMHPMTKRTVPLLSAGDIEINYYRLQAAENVGRFTFYCGKSTQVFKGGKERYGNSARFYPRAGEWIHVAAAWEVDPEKRYGVWHRHFHVFLNGRKYDWRGGSPGLLRMEGQVRDYEIVVPEQVVLGACNGTVDELRISDTVRYTEDFAPPDRAFTADEHTRLLAHFDGALDVERGPALRLVGR